MKPLPQSSAAPLKFHRNHCPGVVISGNETLATWRTRKTGNLRLAFSSRQISRNEKVYVRVMENSILNESQPDNQKKAFFSFTTFDPAKLSTAAGQLELHMIDIGNLMTENLRKGAVYSFWVGEDGKVYRGSDCQKEGPVPGIDLIPPNEKIWFVARSRGNITLKFVESDIVFLIPGEMMPGGQRSPITYVYPDLANAFAHIMQASNNNNSESQLPSIQ